MAKIRTLQLYRGTEAQNDAYTGSIGELTMDTTNNKLRLHDGSTAGGHEIGGSSYHPDLFDHKWADHILNDVSWLRADTFSWQSGAVYQAAYQHLVEDVQGKEYISETIGGHTVWYRLADDGHKIVTQASDYDGSSAVNYIYEATGVAWYYVLDETNQRFKLPRVNPEKELLEKTLVSIVSNGLQPRFTNGSATGYLRQAMKNLSGYTYYMYADGVGLSEWDSTALTFGDETGLKLDWSQSQSYYKGNKYLYFYVGNFTQTALENTAGLNAELFNNKVDVGHQVIEFQDPTAANNYTWYRKYSDGWVEQGGVEIASGSIITLPIAMADTKYTVQTTPTWGTANSSGTRGMASYLKTTTSFCAQQDSNSGSFDWQVSGIAAN